MLCIKDCSSNPSVEHFVLFSGICDSVQISIKPTGTTFLTGSDLVLRCKCYVYPAGRYTWTKDGKDLTYDGRISMGRNKLLINNATISDSGKYQCNVTTQDGSVEKSSSTPLSFTVVGKSFL